MPSPRRSDDQLRAVVDAVKQHGSAGAAARALGVPPTTMEKQAAAARLRWPGCLPVAKGGRHVQVPPAPAGAVQLPFQVEPLPSALPSIDELLARRRTEFNRVHAAKEARRLIDVAIRLNGPIGIAHGGDPHLDDSGTNLPLIERHVAVMRRTEGLLAANVGDYQNNWVGRLGRLFGEQSTSHAEAWQLVEWFIGQLPWLYLIGGNHDVWSGAGDPLRWITGQAPGVAESHGARLNLRFPNGRQVRVNARHDFRGHSMWNTAHGPAKAVQMGWRDHILTCGHLHTTGYQLLKDPASGLISHAIRVASYKWHDRYADQLGLPDQNISENVVTVIDPEATEERRLVTTFLDLEEAAEFLTWKRAKWAAGKRVNA